MEEEQGSFVLSDQSLESLRQMAATVAELSAAVASINQSIERFGISHLRTSTIVILTLNFRVTRVAPSVKNLAKAFGTTSADSP